MKRVYVRNMITRLQCLCSDRPNCVYRRHEVFILFGVVRLILGKN